MAWLAVSGGAAPAPAQDAMALVSEKGFDCFVRHLGSYLDQGQEIVVDFEDCPSQPGEMQRMKAREATNLLPAPPRLPSSAAPAPRLLPDVDIRRPPALAAPAPRRLPDVDIRRPPVPPAPALLPGARNRGAETAPAYRKYMILDPDTAVCLRRNAARVRDRAENGLVALIPADCRP